MDKLDVLHFRLVERMSGVIREILEEVKAAIKGYEEEADRARAENTHLRQQLRDALSSTETDLHGQVHHVPQHVPHCVPQHVPDEDTELPVITRITCEFKNEQKTAENQQHQQNREVQTQSQSLYSSSERMPCSHDSFSSLNTEGREGDLKESSPVVSPPSEEEQMADDGWNVMLPIVGTEKIKVEPDDTIITVTSLVTTTPVHAGQCQDSEVTHQLRATCDASSTSRKTQRKEIHSTRHLRPRKDSLKTSGTHFHEKPYTCDRCGRQLTSFKRLQLHKRVHDTPFNCQWCGKIFTRTQYLLVHERIHTGERPFRCNWCSKSFNQKGNMVRHERVKHTQRLRTTATTTTTTVDKVEESTPSCD